MTEEQFLKSTMRQLLILEGFHSNYFKNGLREVASEIIEVFYGDNEEKDEIVQVDSFSALF